MALAYWREGRTEEPAIFDYFFRKLPFGGGYAVFAGTPTLVDCLTKFRYDETQLAFLAEDGFPADFLEYLRGFSFEGSIFAAPEGEIVFPIEPIVRVEAPLLQAQIIETLLLNVLNFQTLIATKAARCRRSAGERKLSEFGLRRAQGLGSLWASRAACVGGFDTTSNLHAGQKYALPVAGTMAHSFVQSYPSELEAFRRFASAHGSQTVLLLDTYNTLRSGLPNALIVARELAERGESLAGVRLDSGDLAYLARQTRQQLDAAGLSDVKIVASNQLDEYVIRSLLEQGAPIDLFGVGTSIATGAPDGALDGVYKLAAVNGEARLKVSDNITKSTLPGRKQVTRFVNEAGAFMADAVHLADETDFSRMIHPFEPHKQLDLSAWIREPLLQPLLENGRTLSPSRNVSRSAEYARERLSLLPPEHARFEYPHEYKVGLSPRLHDLRDQLLDDNLKQLAP